MEPTMSAVNTQTVNAASNETSPVSDETSLSTLFGGIVTDVQKLLEDHLHLLRLEVEEDFEKSKNAIYPMVIGTSLMVTAFLFLILALIGWLAWLVPSVPWFGWSAILAGTISLLGGVLLFLAFRRWQRVNPMPGKTLRSVKKAVERINQQVNVE
jgi:uncharacterized membrane protein YqjE